MFPNISSFLLYLHYMMWVNVKLDISGFQGCRLHWSHSFLMVQLKRSWQYYHFGIAGDSFAKRVRIPPLPKIYYGPHWIKWSLFRKKSIVRWVSEPDEMNYLLNWSYLTAGDGRNKVGGVTSGGIHHRPMMTPKLHAENKLDVNLQSS